MIVNVSIVIVVLIVLTLLVRGRNIDVVAFVPFCQWLCYYRRRLSSFQMLIVALPQKRYLWDGVAITISELRVGVCVSVRMVNKLSVMYHFKETGWMC